jgi:hypothetical protein
MTLREQFAGSIRGRPVFLERRGASGRPGAFRALHRGVGELKKIGILTCIACLALSSASAQSQRKSTKQELAGTESVGDLVQDEQTPITTSSGKQGQPKGLTTSEPPPIHILYLHGINQVGPGDSLPLRKSICRYLKKCTVSSLHRIYVDSGALAADGPWPALLYLNIPIWTSRDEWNASAPFLIVMRSLETAT